MAIYFIYDSPFIEPNAKFTKKIEEESILSFFQKTWRTDLDYNELYNWYKECFGCHFYGLRQLSYGINYPEEWVFNSIREYQLNINEPFPPPSSWEDLGKYLKVFCYPSGITLNEEGTFLQILTDDDEFELAWYMIDERFATQHPEKVAYLIQENWKLPLNTGDGSFYTNLDVEKFSSYSSSGNTYLVLFEHEERISTPYLFEGIQLSQFIDFLNHGNLDFNELPSLLLLWRAIFINKEFQGEIFKNFLDEKITYVQRIWHTYFDYDDQKLASNDPQIVLSELDKAIKIMFNKEAKSAWKKADDRLKVHGNAHLIQLSIHTDTWMEHPVDEHIKNGKLYDHIILFDDKWASQNYHLANSILYLAYPLIYKGI